MTIRKSPSLDSPELSELLVACEAHDGFARLETEQALNVHPEMPSWFIASEGSQVVAALSIFQPASAEAEIGVLCHPDSRRRGFASALIAAAEVELACFGCQDELLVVDSRSGPGAAMAERLGARLEYTELGMRYTGTPAPREDARVRLERAGIDRLDELLSIRGEARVGDPEDRRAFERSALLAPNREEYIARLAGKAVGACSLSFEPGRTSINGLVVAETERGKGYGQAILCEALRLLEGRGLEIALDVDASNVAALHIYEKLGFEAIEAIGYYRRRIPLQLR